jgi:outer membrane receptor protein involved in Fe transport
MTVTFRSAVGLAAALVLTPLLSATLSAQSQTQSQPRPPARTQSQAPATERARLTGRVIDAVTSEGVAYATVSIVDSLGVPLASWAADGKGAFDHEVKITGRWRVTAAAIGFDRSAKEFDIAAPATELGDIPLSSGGVQIEGVVVTAAPPLVSADIDKITYNVAADPEAPVNTLLDMLRKVPLLSVDAEDNVLMQGQSNYKVLVNGKSSSMMDRSFKEVVRSMPANSIKNIEVITSPSSRYEAEGIGGIINIITDKGRLGGFNGSLNLGADSFGSLNAGGFLNATTGKFTVSGYVSAMQQRRPGGRNETFQENYLADDFRFQRGNGSSRMRAEGMFYNIQASYEIDSLNLLTLSLMGQNFGVTSNSDAGTVISNADNQTVRQFTNTGIHDSGFGYLSGNLDYQRLFKKPDRILTASYKISADNNNSNSLIRIDGLMDYPSYQQRSVDDAMFREHTLQLDYVDPLTDKHSIETGFKTILRQNNSDPETLLRDADADPWVVDPSKRNALDYDQYILQIYGAYQFKLKKFSVKAGLRVETTWNDGLFQSVKGDTPFNNRQFNPVPNITLSYAPKPTNRMSLSYTQRLSRPGIWYLNPYINDNDPMNISFGNPELDAEVGHTFNATYGIFGPKTNLNISAGAAFLNNGIERISTADDHGMTTSTYFNVGQTARYNLNAYWSWRPSAKFTISAGGNGSYADLKGGNNLANSGFSFNGNLQTRVSLWKDGTANANVFYSSPRVMLQGESMGYYYYGFGLSQRAFNQKVTFTLSANMPFTKDMHYFTITDDATFYRRSDNWSPSRTVRFNASWNFGKTQVQVKRARRGITNDDQKAGESSTPSTQQ